MDIPIEIPVDEEKPRRRGVPPRFEAMLKKKEAAAASPGIVEEQPKVENTPTDDTTTVRRVRVNQIQESLNPCSFEEAESKLSSIYPDYSTMKETLDNNPKWQDKVQAVNLFIQFLRSEGSNHSECGESAIVFAKHFSKEFKAANMNILKCCLDCVKAAIETCGAGPRACGSVVVGLVPKLHDRKLGPDVSDLYMIIAENVGPNVVITSLSEAMSKSKIPVQQKAALQILLRLVTEFGASSLDLKSLFVYLKSEQALSNPHVEVKTQAIEVVSSLHRQVGPVIRQLVMQSGLNDLLTKSIEEALSASPYDPELAKRYSPVHPAPSSETPSETPIQPAVCLSDLVEKADITKEVSNMLKGLKDTEGKESWKRRQQAVIDLSSLLSKRVRIVNNPVVGEIASILKDRLSESNLNLKAKVIECIGQLASALGEDVNQYSGLASELFRCVGDSNRNVAEALYNTLTKWVVHDNQPSSQSLNMLIPLLPNALKSIKSRYSVLHWLNQFLSLGDPKSILLLIPSLLDCLVDRVKEVRDEAFHSFQIVIPKCGQGAVEDRIQNRKPAEIQSIRVALGPLFQSAQSVQSVQSSQGLSPSVPTVDVGQSDMESRLKSLASRPGARVLGKRPGGGLAATMKRQAVSSIPKPQALKSKKPEKVVNSVTEPVVVPIEVPIETPRIETPIETPRMESSFTQPQFSFEADVAATQIPSYRCESVCSQLQSTNEMLLTQRELQQFEGVSLQKRSYSGVYHLIASIAEFVASITEQTPLNHSRKNECICASAEICQIIDSSSCVLMGDRLNVNDSMRNELERMSDCVLQLYAQLFLHIQDFIDNQESLLLLNMLNAVTVMISDTTTHSFIHSHTLTQFISTLIQALSSPFELVFDKSVIPLRNLIHSLLLLITDKVSLSLLLPSLAALPAEFSHYWLNGSENENVLLLLRRILIRVLSRVNTSQFTDTERRQCVEAIRCELPDTMPEVLRREYETYMHVLEPLVSTSFGGVLRSGTPLFTKHDFFTVRSKHSLSY